MIRFAPSLIVRPRLQGLLTTSETFAWRAIRSCEKFASLAPHDALFEPSSFNTQ